MRRKGIVMKQKPVVRRRISFYGQVQAVGFRYQAMRAADMYGASGWVRNEYDGSVTMEIQGTERQIDSVVAYICNSMYIQVDRMEAKSLPVIFEDHGFRVKY